jgi:hypothetical protein
MTSLWNQISNTRDKLLEEESAQAWRQRRKVGRRFVLFVGPARTASYRVELSDTDGRTYTRAKIRYTKTWDQAMAVAADWSLKHRVEPEDKHYTE